MARSAIRIALTGFSASRTSIYPAFRNRNRPPRPRAQGVITGRMLARPAQAGEAILTMEGTVVASGGAWVVEGNSGEQWVVPGAKFLVNYQPVEA